MAKRSDFKRIPRDLYRTIDPRAGQALIPHLRKGMTYKEPFAGAGDLIAQLAGHAVCVHASDIVPLADGIVQADAFDIERGDADAMITNCPWLRPILHRTIVHFSDQGPLWLLFDAGWAFTAQAAPYLDRCRKIVVVGRLRWIPGTKMQSVDDAAWYELGPPIPGSRPVFYGRGIGPVETSRGPVRACYDCGKPMGSRTRWKLVKRAGVTTPVHRFACGNPNAHVEPPEPAPLLDYIERLS